MYNRGAYFTEVSPVPLVFVILHCVVVRPLTSHPFEIWTEYAGFWLDQARNHKARSAIMCLAGRMRDDLNPAEICRPEACQSSCVWIIAPNEKLYLLVSPLSETATAYTASWVYVEGVQGVNGEITACTSAVRFIFKSLRDDQNKPLVFVLPNLL